MKPPRVTVAMPVYNCEKYVAKAVESILTQTFEDFEFLIVDDGSTDSSRAILEQYSARDPRIKLVSRPNTGLLVALNEMVGRARGEYVARMDADDVALPGRFERQVQYLDEHPECVLLGSRVIIIDPDGDPLKEMGDALTHDEIDDIFMMHGGQIVYHPSVMYRRQVVLDLGCYRPEFTSPRIWTCSCDWRRSEGSPTWPSRCFSTANISTRSATDASSSRTMRPGEP